MRAFLLLLLIALTTATSAQAFERSAKKYRNKFKYDAGAGETVVRTWHHYVVSSDANGKFIVRIFYPETRRLTGVITFLDEKLTIKDGPYQHWFDDGEVDEKGSYLNGQRTGPWKEHEAEGVYEADKRHGIWTLRDEFGSMGTGGYDHGLRSGEWTSRDSSGQVTQVLNYVRDTLHGACLEFTGPGSEPLKRIYAMGRLIEGPHASERRIQEPRMAKCAVLDPQGTRGRECTVTELHKHIGRTIQYPARSIELGITGKALIQFTVDKNGEVIDVVAKSGLCADIEKECLRVVKSSPAWIPGTRDGKPVKCRFTIPIMFKLR